MIWANVTKFRQNFIVPQIFLGWYSYGSNTRGKVTTYECCDVIILYNSNAKKQLFISTVVCGLGMQVMRCTTNKFFCDDL